MKRILIFVLVFVVLVVAGLSVFIYSVARSNVPDYGARHTSVPIGDSLKIYWDDAGVPQIMATSEQDALFALGWLHASERFFQMDLTRRFAQGRLSELLGTLTVELDIEQRRVGHTRLAQNAVTRLANADRKRLNAYAAGINHYLETTSYKPFEYYILRAETEPWNVYDILTLQSFQTWFSDALQNKDELIWQIYHQLGADSARMVPAFYPTDAPFTIPADVSQSYLPADPRNYIARHYLNSLLTPRMSRASNAWVLAPQKSSSGEAMLASDPHLQVNSLPQFWFFCGMHIADSLNAMGVTAAGLPFIAMGSNGSAAWAFTAGGVDVTEYYEEELNPADSLSYRVDNGWQKFEQLQETIVIAGEDPLNFDVHLSRHGPIVLRHADGSKVYALDWAGYDANLAASVSAGFNLVRVKSFVSYRETVTRFGALNANWMYADRNGNIGYQLGTPIPVRPPDYDNLPLPGAEMDNYWDGYYPLEKAPYSENPAQGWLASANNKPASYQTLGYDLPGHYFDGRIRRLHELLQGPGKLSVQDVKEMHGDIVDPLLRDWAKVLDETNTAKTKEHLLLKNRVQNWDGSCDLESKEAAFFSLYERIYSRTVFEDELGELAASMRQSWARNVYRNPQSPFHDDTRTRLSESRDELSTAILDSLLAKGMDKGWGELQKLRMAHPLAQVPGLSLLLGLDYGPWPWAGTENTLNAAFSRYSPQKGFDVLVGPSWRYIVDFSKPDEASMILPAGNSGHPLSPWYFNMFGQWRDGTYHKVSLQKDYIIQNAKFVTTLTPTETRND